MSSTEIYPGPNIPNRHVSQPNIHNIHWPQANNSLPPPCLPEIFSTDDGSFEPALRLLRGSPKNWLLAFSDALVGSNGHFTSQNIGCLFYNRTARAPFSVKTNITGVLILFFIVTQLTVRINPRINYLNTTAFPQSESKDDDYSKIFFIEKNKEKMKK